MNLPPAPPVYSAPNEQAARNAIALADEATMKADRAYDFLQLVDQVTGEPGKLTVESGVLIWTAL